MGWTALHYACEMGHADVVRYFIVDLGHAFLANEATTAEGHTPLVLAAAAKHGSAKGWEEMAEILLDAGASVNGCDNLTEKVYSTYTPYVQ